MWSIFCPFSVSGTIGIAKGLGGLKLPWLPDQHFFLCVPHIYFQTWFWGLKPLGCPAKNFWASQALKEDDNLFWPLSTGTGAKESKATKMMMTFFSCQYFSKLESIAPFGNSGYATVWHHYHKGFYSHNYSYTQLSIVCSSVRFIVLNLIVQTFLVFLLISQLNYVYFACTEQPS